MDIYTNKQLAELLSASEDSVRNAKSRNKDRFDEGVHFVKDESGRVLWTREGCVVVAEILGRDLQGHDSVTLNSHDSVTEGHDFVTEGHDQEIDNLLSPLANKIATQVIVKRLPVLVEGAVRRILERPTEEDRLFLDRLYRSFGVLGAVRHLNGLPTEVAREISRSSVPESLYQVLAPTRREGCL